MNENPRFKFVIHQGTHLRNSILFKVDDVVVYGVVLPVLNLFSCYRAVCCCYDIYRHTFFVCFETKVLNLLTIEEYSSLSILMEKNHVHSSTPVLPEFELDTQHFGTLYRKAWYQDSCPLWGQNHSYKYENESVTYFSTQGQKMWHVLSVISFTWKQGSFIPSSLA